MRDLAFSLVRVLDPKHKAVGDWDPKLDADTVREMDSEIALPVLPKSASPVNPPAEWRAMEPQVDVSREPYCFPGRQRPRAEGR